MKSNQSVRLPGTSDRITIIGRTGSGKTQAGIWHLSKQNIDRMPWVIIDYKNDILINSIEKSTIIDYDTVPTKPGIYILKVFPGDEEFLNSWMKKVWENGNVGIYVDEGYMIGRDNRGFNTNLTQGRSLKIPMIVLTQRPVWLSRFVFSESNFFQVFHLNDKDDRRTIKRFVPANLDHRLKEYHSYYYDVDKDNLITLSPVPDADTILRNIDEKLPTKKRTI